jgi:hypothetical protein
MQAIVLNFGTIPIFGSALGLTLFTVSVVVLLFGLRLWLNRDRWHTELRWLIIMVPILAVVWYAVYRFPVVPPIVISDSAHQALSISLLILAIGLLPVVVYYRFVRKLKVTPRYVQGMLWVLILGGLCNTLVFR